MPERPKTGSGKKFSITIQVPDDVAAQWPERSTAEKLIHEVYSAMGGGPAPRAEPPRARRGMVAILLAGLFAGGVIGGYLGARGFLALSAPAARPVTTTSPRAAPAPARSMPTAEPASPARPPQADLSVSPAPAAEPQPLLPVVLPTPTGPAAGAPATVFNVQVGAYRVQGNAEALIEQLRQDGFKAHVVQFSGMYLVQMGTFQTRGDADRLVAKLKAKHYDAFVIQLSTSGN